MWLTLPQFGSLMVYAVLICAAYTFAVAVAAGSGRPRLLRSARLGAYATSGLILFAVLLLAYAFVTHDFRIRYVSRYSDRSMSTTYLLTALWGGQDGSLLWWSLLLGGYIAACIRWLRGRYRELQPYVIATLMVIVGFFAILMIFAANPFQTNMGGAMADGEGLNPLLQNYWMIIHPPALYMGFVGCAVPFAFAVAALVTGRLDNEWIIAVRKWMLFAFLFLSIGNVLGMLWAYEELGWGGYWAWDPVENAACLPWFTAAAYVHSTMIQERRNFLKIWNVFLICLTFFLTIFGTFLTRSGLIASVHSFAKSDIGIYFVGFMGVIVAASAGLIVWRLPKLRGRAQIESMASREAMFVINNWALLGMMTFILVFTMWPKISELFSDESVTFGKPFFDRWIAPLGLVVFALMGLAPLFGWRKTSDVSLKRAFAFPLGAAAVSALAHLTLGNSLGFPAFVDFASFDTGAASVILDPLKQALPLATITLVGFNIAVILQEFYRGVRARQAAAAKRNDHETVGVALWRLVAKSRRRYGGYIVHLGIIAMFVGFVGQAWGIDKETSLTPGQTYKIGNYDITYEGPRMCPGNPECSPAEAADIEKRMIFARVSVARGGELVASLDPAKFIYKNNPMGPTTEVALLRGLREDLYVIVGTVDPSSKRATFQFHVNPLVGWIWLGVLILIAGCSISLWPEVRTRELGVWAYVRAAGGATAGIALSIYLAMAPATAYAHPRPEPPKPAARAETRATTAPELPWVVATAGLGLALGGLSIAGLSRRRIRRTHQL